ncbi:hypothetical protein Q428_07895 [Fervidicella metallireducens AeB]|uniref:Uncharacterized protein n=1 Tax=Fervidicella metallireducens AeB TaxID=1403537 RepID=A0A017RUH8_9CLOT|nr:hypothetical protein [Fervidicella metallireducens]EYE88433.1 hypothetical protein Q428_07895 [Fervidicella metallireducens AeB]
MHNKTMVGEIINYVDNNRFTNESALICNKILGNTDRIDDEVVNELHARLGRAKIDVIQSCYKLIK